MKKMVMTLWVLGASLAAQAAEPVYAKDGAAIGGYDPVAYFTVGKPTKGKAEIETEWKGARWRFSTSEHRDAFEAEPTRYAPQFGGYCAYGLTKGYAAKTEPHAWRIVDGKLYLNYDKEVQKLWEKGLPAIIAEGEKHWPAALAK
jgi:YHS domain-containing protein